MDVIGIVIVVVLVAGALVAGVIYSAHIHAKALAAVKDGTVIAQGVVTEIHNAEASGKVAEGTVQRFLDSHVALVEAKVKAIAKIL